MINAIIKYYNLSLLEKSLFIETFLISIKVRFLIKFFSMKTYVKNLGQENKLSENITNDDIENLKQYAQSVKRVSRNSFWRTKCFEEAFALKLLLENHGQKSTIFFGVAKGDSTELNAHSWLKIGDKVLIGGNGYEKYTVTKYFT